MDRRRFLFNSACFLAGGLMGFGRIPKVSASDRQDHAPFPHTPRIALIIDDIGFSAGRTRDFLKLGVPITFSILPCLAQSRDLALEIHDHGHEVMLHQPMEPYSPQVDPGPGALYQGYPRERICHILEENMHSVPFAVGVNNHMGSKFTECPKEVHDVLTVIRRQGMFFVDSLTTSHSKAYETARQLRMPAAYRNMFLDNVCDESAIHAQLHKLLQRASTRGYAIGIGHPHPETANAVGRFLKDFDQAGVSLVHVSQVLFSNAPAVDHKEGDRIFGDFT